MSRTLRPAPPDQAQRECALDPARSILVQAPAGSGKTDLLTKRFLRLLAEVDDPAHIVAITFTKAAAAEMRNRILSELEKAATGHSASSDSEFSMEALAARAIDRSRALGWNILQLPAQLRISTIDSFCREIAIRRPLLSTLGGGLEVSEQQDDLYRRAARSTLLQLGSPNRVSSALREAIESLLLWRDNNWPELENQLVLMLSQRDRWMQEFWLRDFDRTSEADWQALRERLEAPFARAVAEQLATVSRLLSRVPGACDEAMELVRFACRNLDHTTYNELAELAEFPAGPFPTAHQLEDARLAYSCLAQLLLTNEGAFRQSLNKNHGFPADRKREKQRMQQLIQSLSDVEGLQSALAAVRDLPPARYSDEDWRIVRACFTLLRHATAELQVAFAESGAVDFIEIAQIAQRILEGEDNLPSDAALDIADGIHHLLVDEFQDTSRRQHKLLAALVSAWPDTSNRTLFVVGDPMQSIYFFRDADAELFPRVQTLGLELPDAEPLPLHFVQLESNFRTRPALVNQLNQAFEAVFGVSDGSNVQFSASQPARPATHAAEPHFDLHLKFVPQLPRATSGDHDSARLKQQAMERRETALASQVAEIVALIRSRTDRMEQARASDNKHYRIAVLGRTRSALAPIAQALRDVSIPFRAVDLEQLADRPEVLDVLALARALMNREDRVAWLGVLRAPWCGLSLPDLHLLAGADDPEISRRAVPDLLRERASLLSPDGRVAVDRLLRASSDASAFRTAMPQMSTGAWLEQVWRRLGGESCVDATARANLQLLWRCLDKLPGGEPDLNGPALQAALQKLTAQPDPAAEADYGVHLMTIHKSKGLEFEVVIIPELQAGCGTTRGAMFSWLERGLANPDDSGAITEFLIAPFQPRGSDRGKAKEWVDREYRTREAQETRRVFYVAATRAREELHLFARLGFKDDHGDLTLCDPPRSLLSTAWPALEEDVRDRFETWKSTQEPAELANIAAGANNVIVMPPPAKPALLHRLPIDFAAPSLPRLAASDPLSVKAPDDSFLYKRHEGGIVSRALGSAVHLAFQELARLRTLHDWDASRTRLLQLSDRLAAQVRAHGVDREQADALAKQSLDVVLRASSDPIAQWILSPHADATTEERWTGVVDGTLRTVQADRVFRAGSQPMGEGKDIWWIVDYKTAHGENLAPAEALPTLRELFAPQVEAYGRILRKLHGATATIRGGLYYPRMQQFDWWEL
jgi:ATP-dependent exoDNAse (exonuclease V) beta subunit